jgi:hypothetical protein
MPAAKREISQPKPHRWQAYNEVITASAQLEPVVTCIMKLHWHLNHIGVRSFVPSGPPCSYMIASCLLARLPGVEALRILSSYRAVVDKIACRPCFASMQQ